MTYAQATYLLPFLACVLVILFGLFAVLAPERAARWWGIDQGDPTHVRIVLGGMPIFAAAFGLYWQAPSAFWSVGAGWLGAAAFRLAQIGRSRIVWRAAWLELAFALCLLIGFFTN